MRRSVKLELETLESRDMPSAFGNAWPDAQNLTLSFAPDGTTITSYDQVAPSALYSALSAAGSSTNWQNQILQAFQTWAVQTNINIGLTPDAATPFGVDARLAGVAASGKIRVGAFSTSQEVIAINQPYNVLTGAWSGVLLYNTSHNFSIGDSSGNFDIRSATLDEAGNIFGMADTNDPTSALYGHYLGVRAGLNSADIAAIQAMYGGTRQQDQFECTTGNDSLSTASRRTASSVPNSPTDFMVSANGDLTTMSDVDYFVFTTQPSTSSLTIRLDTAGLSLLTAKISVFDQNNNLVATAVSDGPLGMQDIAIYIADAAPNSDYTVRVERATNDVFGIGRYNLRVGYNFDPASIAAPPPTSPNFNEGVNETRAQATVLAPVVGSANQNYTHAGSISSFTDVNWYRMTSPSTASLPITVIINPSGPFQLNVRATVYDSNGTLLSSKILANGADGRFVLQASNPIASSQYFVKVESVLGAIGNYSLNVDFNRPAVDISTAASGALTATQSTSLRTLTVTKTSAIYFALDASGASATNDLKMAILNASGTQLATMTTVAGDTTTGVMLISAGTYYIRFDAVSTTSPIQTLDYCLRAQVVSDPIDPYAPPDPTVPPAPPPSVFTVIDQGNPFYAMLGLVSTYASPWLPPAPLPPPPPPILP